MSLLSREARRRNDAFDDHRKEYGRDGDWHGQRVYPSHPCFGASRMPGMIQPHRTLLWHTNGTVDVTVSPLTGGPARTRTLPITREQWDAWQGGEYIQRAMPHLSASDREFLLSGMTDEDFEKMRDEDEDV
jgi:hypothetical protein